MSVSNARTVPPPSTATESAGIAVIYAILLCSLFYRELTFKGFYGALLETGRLAAVALFCVGTASAFGWLLAYYQIPKAILAGVSSWGSPGRSAREFRFATDIPLRAERKPSPPGVFL